MRGIPSNFEDLVEGYASTLEAVGAPGVEQIAGYLHTRGVLQKYTPPKQVTLVELCDFVGVEVGTFFAAVHRNQKQPTEVRQYIPTPEEGSLWSKKALYSMRDVTRLLNYRQRVFPTQARRGFLKSIAPGFTDWLKARALETAEEYQKYNGLYKIPPHLPSNMDEVVRNFQGEVVRAVRATIKHTIDIDDSISTVWTGLIGTNLVTKFMASSHKRLPPQLSEGEVLAYLGVSQSEWSDMLDNFELPPQLDCEGLYSKESIVALDESGYFKVRSNPRTPPASSVTQSQFRAYVYISASSRAKNVIRTYERRYARELVMKEGTLLNGRGDGSYSRYVKPEDRESANWVDSLRSDALHGEAALILKQRLGLAGEVPELFNSLAYG